MHERLHGLLAWFHHESISTDGSWLCPPPKVWFPYESTVNLKEPLFTAVTVTGGLVPSLRWQWQKLTCWCHQRGSVWERYELLALRCKSERLSIIMTCYRGKRTDLRLALESKIFPCIHGREWSRLANWMGSEAILNSDLASRFYLRCLEQVSRSGKSYPSACGFSWWETLFYLLPVRIAM